MASKFSYFYGDELDVDSSSTDNSSDDEATEQEKCLSFITKTQPSNKDEKAIPSAKLILEKDLKPEFLIKRKDLDWYKLTKDKSVAEEEVDLSNTHAIPPPKTYEPQTDNLTPTLGVKSQKSENSAGNKRTHSSTDKEGDVSEEKKLKPEDHT